MSRRQEIANDLDRHASELEEQAEALGDVEPDSLTLRSVQLMREAASNLRRTADDLSKERWGVCEDPED